MYPVSYKYKIDYSYYPNHEGTYPVVVVYIESNGKETVFPAIVDTGAQNTLVSPEYAIEIGLVLNKGKVKNFKPARGDSFMAYGHQVQVRILDELFQAELFFPEFRLPRCLIGRDILEKMQIGLKESHSTLYLF